MLIHTKRESILGAINSETVRLFMSDPNSSILIKPETKESLKLVVMPVRI